MSEERIQEQLQRDLKALRSRHRRLRSELTLLRSPFRTMRHFIAETLLHIGHALNVLIKHWILSLLALCSLAALVILRSLSGPHEETVEALFKWGTIAIEWIILGVLSSVGLGSGLHTFLLYLGPFIAKVTLAAHECNSVDFETYGDNAFICPSATAAAAVGVSFWSVLRKVQFEALCWGIGTAIGELPPYFVARAARLSGKKLESIEGGEDEDDSDNDDDDADGGDKTSTQDTPASQSLTDRLMEKARSVLDLFLGRSPFITILLMASIPNPLFDLAGLTCGYALISFWVFFSATVLGKAFIKAHLQAVTVVTIFSKEHIDTVINLIEWVVPFLRGKASAYFDKERQRFHPDTAGSASASIGEKSILARTWDVLLISMLAMFAISIINSMAQSHLMEQQKKEIADFKRKHTEQLQSSSSGNSTSSTD